MNTINQARTSTNDDTVVVDPVNARPANGLMDKLVTPPYLGGVAINADSLKAALTSIRSQNGWALMKC